MKSRKLGCVALISLCSGAATPLVSQQPAQAISVHTMGCAMQSGRARCYGWGPYMANFSGRAVRDVDTLQALPGDPGLVSIRTFAITVCGLTPTGAMYCMGQTHPGDGPFTQETPGLIREGNDYAARLVPVASALRFRAFAMADNKVCGSTLNGQLYCWGNAATPRGRSQGLRRIAGAPPFVQMETGAGTNIFCGLTAAGRAWCWRIAAWPAPHPNPLPGGLVFTSLSVGMQTCGLTADGDMWCFEGDGSDPTLKPFRLFEGTHFRRLSLSAQFGCGITMDGVAVCWGDNMDEDLGSGIDWSSMHSSATLLPVATTVRFVDISTGDWAAGAITDDGRVYHWGACYCGSTPPQEIRTPTLSPMEPGPAR